MSFRLRRLTGLLLAAVAVLPAVAEAEVTPEVQSRIVGGQPASRAYPYQALLEVNFGASGTARCAGSLVAARYIVTAAHCLDIEGQQPSSIDVTLGSANVASSPPNFTVISFKRHPSYGSGPGGGYDVAVLLLNKAATNGSGIDFEQLRLLRPTDTGLWQAGTTATVIGWGLTEDANQGGTASNQLLEVKIPVYSDAGCDSDFQVAKAPPGFFSPLTMVCAGGKDGKDACNGDSGGPLLVPDGNRFALAGVVSFGAVVEDANQNKYSCAEDLPGVYSRVAADPLNAFVRQNLPQVEIDANPAAPDPGQTVALQAAGANPNGAYESFKWDLDNDGAFDDATGATSSVVVPRGITTVGVLATRGLGDQGDREVRRIDLEGRFRSPVAFAAPTIQVTEGQPVTVTVNKAGAGTGTVVATPTTGTAAIGGVDVVASSPTGLTFAADQTTQTFTIPTVDDTVVEPAESFRLDLGGYGGELLAGNPIQLAVTIVDNDVAPKIIGRTKSAKVRKGKIKLKYSVNAKATVVLGLTDSRGRRVYASTRKRHSKAGTYTATLRITRSGRAALRKKRIVRARAVYAIFKGNDLLASKVLKFKLRR